jgi:hypothetical protein
MQAQFSNLLHFDTSLIPVQSKRGGRLTIYKSHYFIYFSIAMMFGLFVTSNHTLGQNKDKKVASDNGITVRRDTTSTVPDNTYGDGGKKRVIVEKSTHPANHEDDSEIETTELIDGKGKVRERTIRMTTKGGGKASHEYVSKWGNSGVLIYFKEVETNEIGDRIKLDERRYKDERMPENQRRSKDLIEYEQGIKTYGYYEYIDDKGTRHVKIYNPKTKEEEDAGNNAMPESNPSNIGQIESAPVSNASYEKNEVFVGPALMHQDYEGSKYNSWGADGSYTRIIGPHVGVTADVGIYWHKEMEEQNYTYSLRQYNITAGPTFFPFQNALSTQNKFCFSVHLYGGYANLKSSYKSSDSSGTYSYSDSQGSFTLTAGLCLDLRLNKHLGIRLQPDYTPTFFKQNYYGSTQNNFRASLGLVARF